MRNNYYLVQHVGIFMHFIPNFKMMVAAERPWFLPKISNEFIPINMLFPITTVVSSKNECKMLPYMLYVRYMCVQIARVIKAPVNITFYFYFIQAPPCLLLMVHDVTWAGHVFAKMLVIVYYLLATYLPYKLGAGAKRTTAMTNIL